MAFVWQDKREFTFHLFAGLVCVIFDSAICDYSYLISGAASFELRYERRQGPSSQDEFISGEFKTPPFLSPSCIWGRRGKSVDKIGVLSAQRLTIEVIFPNPPPPRLFYILTMITQAARLRNFLGKIQSLAVVYNVEEEDYFTGGGMGVTNMVQHKMEIYDSKPTYNPSANKVRIVSIEEVDFLTSFVGVVPGNKICDLMK